MTLIRSGDNNNHVFDDVIRKFQNGVDDSYVSDYQ